MLVEQFGDAAAGEHAQGCRGDRLDRVLDRAEDRRGEADHVAGQHDVEDLPGALRQPVVTDRPALEQRIDRAADFVLLNDVRPRRHHDVVGLHRRDERKLGLGKRPEQRLASKRTFSAWYEHRPGSPSRPAFIILPTRPGPSKFRKKIKVFVIVTKSPVKTRRTPFKSYEFVSNVASMRRWRLHADRSSRCRPSAGGANLDCCGLTARVGTLACGRSPTHSRISGALARQTRSRIGPGFEAGPSRLTFGRCRCG